MNKILSPMTLQGSKLTGGSYKTDESFTDSATISSIVGSDYTDNWGTWSSTGGYNGFWFTKDQGTSHNGFTYDHESAVVIDINENNTLDSAIELLVTHMVLVMDLKGPGLVFLARNLECIVVIQLPIVLASSKLLRK